MRSQTGWSRMALGVSLAFGLAVAPVEAGRITSTRNAGYEITRIVSQYAGGASETIAPWETEPALPIQGETIIYGTSNLFPESGKVFVWNGQAYEELPPATYTFKADVMQVGPEGTGAPFASASYVTFRFPSGTVNRIQNRFVLFRIFPIPGPNDPGDTVEGVFLRAPSQ